MKAKHIRTQKLLCYTTRRQIGDSAPQNLIQVWRLTLGTNSGRFVGLEVGRVQVVKLVQDTEAWTPGYEESRELEG